MALAFSQRAKLRPTGTKNISVYNTNGEEIFSKEKFSSQNTVIDLSSKPKGIYFVKVIEGERVAVKKIVLL